MKYGTYNDELGYANGPEFDNAFDAILAASDKCRRHSVIVYDDNGKFIKRLSDEERLRIYNEESPKAPASYIYYAFPARTPLALPENEAANWAHILPFKELAIRLGIQFGGWGAPIGCVHFDDPQQGGFSISVRIDYTLAPEMLARFDRLARRLHCPSVLEYNKFGRLKSSKTYKA